MAPLREPGEPVMNVSGWSRSPAFTRTRDLFSDACRDSWHSLYATEFTDDTTDTVIGALLDSPGRRR